mmetsp:Transcript_24799/g.70755  ORF Transcript_24799/g.70755 Transcript_24799/m.70755 type:complete len:231 (-) Transcript_24799:97-789(-)
MGRFAASSCISLGSIVSQSPPRRTPFASAGAALERTTPMGAPRWSSSSGSRRRGPFTALRRPRSRIRARMSGLLLSTSRSSPICFQASVSCQGEPPSRPKPSAAAFPPAAPRDCSASRSASLAPPHCSRSFSISFPARAASPCAPSAPAASCSEGSSPFPSPSPSPSVCSPSRCSWPSPRSSPSPCSSPPPWSRWAPCSPCSCSCCSWVSLWNCSTVSSRLAIRGSSSCG